ncbi:hypothetical protein MKEN_00844700 [Mycena kentingensis (nom. inval.)]|nr:hypothetical protein MKEN_00844700 [Mycena kentingensis (nom. inval.)]
MDSDSSKALLVYGALAFSGLLAARKLLVKDEAAKIPIIRGGSTGMFASYRDAIKFFMDAPELVQAGYDNNPEGVFRLSRIYYWQYVVCGTKLVKEVGNIPNHILSFEKGVEESVHARYTMGAELQENPFHLSVVRNALTRNLHACFPDVRDEITCAFHDVLALEGSEWKPAYVVPTMMNIVARVSNRLFVGLPLCRNQAYLDNNVRYTLGVFSAAKKIGLLPAFLRPILAPYITIKNEAFDVAMELLGPVVAERMRKEEELGKDWPDKPNDMISWLLDLAEGPNRTVGGLVLRILSINMAAIHTSSMAFSHMLLTLAAYPPEEYFLPMRAEAERVIAAEGWSKAALNSMHKIDSFLRETQRVFGNGPVSMSRKVVAKEGLRLSDGTWLPYGSLLCVAAKPAHFDSANHENATTFDGFRFAREREAMVAREGYDPSKDTFGKSMITTAADHLPFGTGKHACPGRFFAATELKAMLAHMLVNYDIKAEVEGVRPPDAVYGMQMTPNPKGRVFFRKRQ